MTPTAPETPQDDLYPRSARKALSAKLQPAQHVCLLSADLTFTEDALLLAASVIQPPGVRPSVPLPPRSTDDSELTPFEVALLGLTYSRARIYLYSRIFGRMTLECMKMKR